MHDHSGFAYLSYGLIFGLIGKVLGIAPEKTFYFSFFIGTIILAAALPFFLSTFTRKKSLIALSTVFLAFYHGTGESHGFFWVVPSFYSVVLFFILFRFITSKRQHIGWFAMAASLSIIYAFMHPMSVYLAFLFPLYLFMHFYFTKTYSLLEIKKALFILFAVLGSAGIQSLYLSYVAQSNYYGLGNSIFQARQAMNGFTHGEVNHHFNYNVTKKDNSGFLASRIDTLNTTYFRYLLPHWAAIFPFTLALWILYYRRKFHLLTFYFSAFFFFVVATIFHEFGFRSAVILWPATYVMAAFSFYYFYDFLDGQLSGIPLLFSRLFSILLLIFFFAINAIFSIGYNLNVNERDNFRLDESFASSLLEKMAPNDDVGLNGVLARTRSGSKLFLDRRVSSYASQPRFIARISQANERKTSGQLSFVRKISLETAYRIGILPRASKPVDHGMLPPIEGYHLDSQFGDISVYERN